MEYQHFCKGQLRPRRAAGGRVTRTRVQHRSSMQKQGANRRHDERSVPTSPPVPLRRSVMRRCHTGVQTWVEQTGRRCRVSLPQSGTSPSDRRHEGLPPSQRGAASAGHVTLPALAATCQTAPATGDPSAARRWEATGLHTLGLTVCVGRQQLTKNMRFWGRGVHNEKLQAQRQTKRKT